jgi:hypothetical protein
MLLVVSHLSLNSTAYKSWSTDTRGYFALQADSVSICTPREEKNVYVTNEAESDAVIAC